MGVSLTGGDPAGGPDAHGARDVLGAIVQPYGTGTVVCVHVMPRSGSTVVAGRHGDALRIRVTAPPVDGRATEAARRALADALGVPPAAVELVAGERSRRKRFAVRDLPIEVARARLAPRLDPRRG